MPFQFTHPQWLALLPVVWAWSIWLAWRTDVSISRARWAAALILRLAVALMMVLALAGLQWKKPVEGMNVFFLLDRAGSRHSGGEAEARKHVLHEQEVAQYKDDRNCPVWHSERSHFLLFELNGRGAGALAARAGSRDLGGKDESRQLLGDA